MGKVRILTVYPNAEADTRDVEESKVFETVCMLEASGGRPFVVGVVDGDVVTALDGVTSPSSDPDTSTPSV